MMHGEKLVQLSLTNRTDQYDDTLRKANGMETMIHKQPKDRMSILLVLYPIGPPGVSHLEVIRALGQSRDDFAFIRELLRLSPSYARVNIVYLTSHRRRRSSRVVRCCRRQSGWRGLGRGHSRLASERKKRLGHDEDYKSALQQYRSVMQ